MSYIDYLYDYFLENIFDPKSLNTKEEQFQKYVDSLKEGDHDED